MIKAVCVCMHVCVRERVCVHRRVVWPQGFNKGYCRGNFRKPEILIQNENMHHLCISSVLCMPQTQRNTLSHTLTTAAGHTLLRPKHIHLCIHTLTKNTAFYSAQRKFKYEYILSVFLLALSIEGIAMLPEDEL